MAQGAILRFSIKDETDTQWYYVSGANVLLSAVPKYLLDDSHNQIVSPTDWPDFNVGYARNEKYYGVFTKFGRPASFTYQAMTILQWLYTKYGCEATAILVIEKQRNDWGYDVIHAGEFDFSQINNYDALGELFFNVSVAERGLAELLKSKENIPQEISFDSDSFLMRHDGHKLSLKYNFVVAYRYEDKEAFDYLTPITELNHDGEVEPLIVSPISLGGYKDNDGTGNDAWLIAKYNIPSCLFDFNWQAGVFNDPASHDAYIKYDLLHIVPGVSSTFHNIFTSGTLSANTQSNFNITKQIALNLAAGDKIYIIGGGFSVTSDPILHAVEVSASSRTIVTGVYQLPPTEIRAYQYFTFLNKLLKKALGSQYEVKSNFLNYDQDRKLNYDSNPKWTVVTSGSAVRQIADAKIKTTISDAYQDMRRWGLGIGIEGNFIRIEKLPYFFQKNRLVYEFNSIGNFRCYSANDYLGNLITVGYETSVDPKEVNGRQDFHVKNNFEFPIKRIAKDINWASPYIASIFATEYARSTVFDNKKSDDSQYDNEVYLLDLNGDPTTFTAGKPNLYRPTGPKYGLSSPDTAYNWGLSPYCTLLHNKELLLAMGYGKPRQSGVITYQQSDKNSGVSRQCDSLLIDEDASMPVSYFSHEPAGTPATPSGPQVDPLFHPTIFEIDAEVPVNLFEIMQAHPENMYGVLRFPYNGHKFDMFILDIAVNPAKRNLYTVRGLSSPLNDLMKLVKNV